MSGKIRTDSKIPPPITLPTTAQEIPPRKENKWDKPSTPKDCLMKVGELVAQPDLSPEQLNNRWREAQRILEAVEDRLWCVLGTSPDTGTEITECKEITIKLVEKAKERLNKIQKGEEEES